MIGHLKYQYLTELLFVSLFVCWFCCCFFIFIFFYYFFFLRPHINLCQFLNKSPLEVIIKVVTISLKCIVIIHLSASRREDHTPPPPHLERKKSLSILSYLV